MNLDRFCIKFFVRPETNIDETTFIEIFHEWIRRQKLKGTLIDVADYRHVPNGPGIMLITHEINYAMDHANGQFGLYAQRKLGEGETHKDRILNVAKATATFGALLESDNRVTGKLSLEGGKFVYMANDRLQAPNTDEAFAALKPDLEAAAAELYPGQSVSITRLENDPRDRLTAVVQVENSVNLATLAQAA
ncbi:MULTISPECIES: hypothetical protein [unclassified Coleofasciculus]|uniref:hypothetical protein n=1 Tax=unclassified Coleofasciculus TaxID=2692782 RepID=UPI001880F039|nr:MULTISPECIES: hypothetical protein [unclassified Coleofasciculus]MBE9127050.1 hypothetical protein [Coleofasciculus sp. LEGE 07081]MBE9147271.1 hypothetical protein [Coleofasciculus sp. LEGE 07092]